jgi:hypothetical protein
MLHSLTLQWPCARIVIRIHRLSAMVDKLKSYSFRTKNNRGFTYTIPSNGELTCIHGRKRGHSRISNLRKWHKISWTKLICNWKQLYVYLFSRTSNYLTAGAEAYCCAWISHTRQDYPGRVIDPSQSRLPTQHAPSTRDKHTCTQRDSNPRSWQSSGSRLTPYTGRPPTPLHTFSLSLSISL